MGLFNSPLKGEKLASLNRTVGVISVRDVDGREKFVDSEKTKRREK